jgi:serine/threonine protein kinase
MTHKGTFMYQAPEVSRGERYGFTADVYSLGVTMYEVCDKVGLEVGKMLTTLPPIFRRRRSRRRNNS